MGTEIEFKPDAYILTRLAEALTENGSMKKTPLHFASRTNWYSFERYLNWLTNKNYVKLQFDGKYVQYQVTENGKEIFNTLLKLKECVKSTRQISAVE